MIITIDGPSGSGKGTLAKYLGNLLNIKVLDSGLFYRYLAMKGNLQNLNEIINLAQYISLQNLADPTLKTEEAAKRASSLSIHQNIRDAVTNRIRNLAKGLDVVVDGRDVGTVIFPNAEIKFYLDADPEIRYARRAKELQSQDNEKEKNAMMERDERDLTREISPLIIPKDAYIVDNSKHSIKETQTMCRMYIRMFHNDIYTRLKPARRKPF
jgi:cytidylate kinase